MSRGEWLGQEPERLPGSERERGPFRRIPMLHGEISSTGQFPFYSWSVDTAFRYPPEALDTLSRCGSAAEAYFLRALFSRPELVTDPKLVYRGLEVRIQHPCRKYRLDVAILAPVVPLAIEIDGIAFHHRSAEQVAEDYLRQRRIAASGYSVIRFTAQEAFGQPDECWNQVDHILAARTAA